MRHHERLMLCAALLLGVGNLIILTAAFGPRAYANTARWLNDLSATTVTIGEGDDAVALSARDGRLAWGDAPTSQAHSTAFANTYRILDALMKTDQYADARVELQDTYGARMKDVQSEYEAFRNQYQDIGPDHPEYESAAARFQKLVETRDALSAEANRAFAALLSEQMESAYREVVTAVEVVADRRKIDIVLQFVPTSEPFTADIPDAARAAIRGRTALRYPEGLDITEAVMAEMALDIE
ncbi:MAG: OmpH family outer membrane protein [Phycisphaerales bacterium]|nr:OmpH family outer membrane protein [Phycisphaerales bacterium]